MVFVGEASARPSQHGHLQILQRLQHVVAIALGVGDVGLGTHPEPAIDAAAEVFCELAVDFLVDFLFALARMDGTCDVLCLGGECHRGAEEGSR